MCSLLLWSAGRCLNSSDSQSPALVDRGNEHGKTQIAPVPPLDLASDHAADMVRTVRTSRVGACTARPVAADRKVRRLLTGARSGLSQVILTEGRCTGLTFVCLRSIY